MGWFSRTPGWQKLVVKAHKAIEMEDDSQAFGLLSEALESCPDDQKEAIRETLTSCSARLFQRNRESAEQLAESGQLDGASERYQLALKFAPTPEERNRMEDRLRGIEQERLKLQEEAEAEPVAGEVVNLDEFDLFNSLTANLPEDLADRYFELPDGFRSAVVALHSGRPIEALGYLEQAAKPRDNAVVLFEHGVCLRALDRTAEAIESLVAAEKLAPDWIAVKLVLTESCWAQRRYDLAEEVLQRAIDVDDQNLDIYWAICRTALLTRTPDYGLEAADVALQIAPDDHRIPIVKGQLLEQVGRVNEALALYEQVLEATWQYDAITDSFVFEQDAALLAARLYRLRGEKLERAEDLYRGLVAVAPPRDRWRYELSLSDVLIRSGRAQEAQEMLEHTVRKIPEADVLGQMRAAELMGKEEKLQALMATLSPEQKEAWEASHNVPEQAEPLPAD